MLPSVEFICCSCCGLTIAASYQELLADETFYCIDCYAAIEHLHATVEPDAEERGKTAEKVWLLAYIYPNKLKSEYEIVREDKRRFRNWDSVVEQTMRAARRLRIKLQTGDKLL